MINHIQNLQDFIQNDTIYNAYLKRPNMVINEFEKSCINHIEDIKWVLDEVNDLYELVNEMKNENIKTRKNEN